MGALGNIFAPRTQTDPSSFGLQNDAPFGFYFSRQRIFRRVLFRFFRAFFRFISEAQKIHPKTRAALVNRSLTRKKCPQRNVQRYFTSWKMGDFSYVFLRTHLGRRPKCEKVGDCSRVFLPHICISESRSKWKNSGIRPILGASKSHFSPFFNCSLSLTKTMPSGFLPLFVPEPRENLPCDASLTSRKCGRRNAVHRKALCFCNF